MKNQFFKNMIGGVIAVAALALLFVAGQSATAQLDLENNLAEIVRGATGEVPKFQLSPTEPEILQLNLPSSTYFRIYGDSIFSDVVINEDSVFNPYTEEDIPDPVANFNVGYSTLDSGTPGIESPPEIARLQVNGNVRVTDLGDQNDPKIYCVCADQFGEMRRCGEFDPANGKLCSGSGVTTNTNTTYSWDIGDWGPCTGNGGSCSGLYTTGICESSGYDEVELFLEEENTTPLGTGNQYCPSITDPRSCRLAKAHQAPAGGGAFLPCVWNSAGSVDSCASATTESSCTAQNSQCSWDETGGTQVQDVTCVDNLGNVVDDSLCPTPVPVATQSCNIDDGGNNTNNPDPDTYSWNIPDWSPCINGTITRDVTCEDQDGNTVADNLCPDPDPIESQSCDTYDWATGPWGICDTGSGGSCSGTPLNAGSSNCQPGAQLGSFPVNPPSGYDYVFSCASQTSEAACQDTIQTLDATAFDNSDVRYCEWEEPVPAGTKVDFNGDPFDWDPQWIYYAPGSNSPQDGLGIACAVSDPNDATQGSCIGYSPAAIPTSGSGTIDGQYWTVIPFGPDAGSWYPVSLQYGPCPESGFGCGTRPMGGGQDGNSVLQEFVVQSATGNAYGTGTDNGNTVTCNARNQSVCEAIPGCTWNQILGGGNQIRVVWCEDQDGNPVDESLCTGTAPADTQSCS